MKNIYKMIADIGKKYDVEKIVLYGSRARGDNRERSDIDIAVFGAATDRKNDIIEAIDQLPTLLDFDIVFISEKTNESLLKNIEKDGIILMNKFDEKYSKFAEAVARLAEALDEYKEYGNSVMRDGIIQRFEFCTELAWKTTREYLLDEEYTEINSPKSIIKKAFSNGLIDDENAWIDLLKARNVTSHIYDEETSVEIFNKIKNIYIKEFEKLLNKLKK